VPHGVHGKEWQLHLDVMGIMDREDDELDQILHKVEYIAADPDRVDITHGDFAGLEPGSKSAEFTRSELRQRIGQTSKILGIEFPVEPDASDSSVTDSRSVAVTDTESVFSAVSAVTGHSDGERGTRGCLFNF